MNRPQRRRMIERVPECFFFKPQGMPLSDMQEIHLSVDQLEAMRLAHLHGLSQEEIGEKMGVSRATVGRILEQAHRSVTDALVNGAALRIEGGSINIKSPRSTQSGCFGADKRGKNEGMDEGLGTERKGRGRRHVKNRGRGRGQRNKS